MYNVFIEDNECLSTPGGCYVCNFYTLIRNLYVVDPPYILPLEGVYFSIQSSILVYIHISIRL